MLAGASFIAIANVLEHTVRTVVRLTSVASDPSALVLISKYPPILSVTLVGLASPILAVAQNRRPP
jgi:hypothetical protein